MPHEHFPFPHLPINETWPARTGAIHRPPIAKVTTRAAELRKRGRDIIDLGQAVLDVPPPDASLDAMRRFVAEASHHAYSPDPGLPELREALAQHVLLRKGAATATAQQIMVTCGANQAYANALLAITRPGDEIITLDPGYFDHGYTIRMAGCSEVPVRLSLDERRQKFTFDLDAIEAAMTPRTRCVTVVSPGNPTGAVADAQFFRQLAELCRPRGVWIVSDETYDMLTFTQRGHVSAATLAYDRVVVLSTFSKSFAMAAWRVGYLFAHPDVIEEAFKVQDALVVCAPVPGQVAVLAGLRVIDAHGRKVVGELRNRKKALFDGLNDSKHLRLMETDGGTFAMARIVENDDDVAFAATVLERAGVVVIPGSAFGDAGRGYVRISFGNRGVDEIRRACRRIDES